MKKLCILLLLLHATTTTKVQAQEQEIQQLLLNIGKLAQFKQILKDLKKGYEIIYKGYTTIKGISEGNFKLHHVFLDGLWQVSPEVKKYKRVKDIINYQLLLVKEYKLAYNRFRKDNNFTPEEINYLGSVYEQLFKQSLTHLDELTTVVTANKLRMSDEERLGAIDQIYSHMQDKLLFLREFNNSTTLLAIQRTHQRNNNQTLENLYGIAQ
ncbi:TerB family tellurite resistance protein [Cytophagaceae bacterium YF14B1]|uniref:TerB family tellurite resistance protein n=1 Tax=Xanthocytophaga flava TaxID=3048013 RepID=A0AAE3QHE4_9BACT|nr:TerB family tellurite resistance protein [Xanthocytophaga flavus]MDJ1478845.1 TerB family tellurite resistance protein [Xanthocytophaga flavus]